VPLTPGQQLFEYRVIRALGQGGFGTVYLAQDTLLDRPVAIKELLPSAQADRAAFQRFLQEARAAGNLNHPSIVTVYALKPADTTTYLVMEYLPGGSLRALLSQRARLPIDEAVRIATDVCDGLAAAHARGIVHRDVKPENILLSAEGRAKVGDFGIAHVPRAASAAYMVGGLTEAGFQPGTLIYMSPEQIRGEAVDGRSDVYQVGALLYEMLTGRCYIDMEALMRRAQETAGGNVLRMQARLYDLLEEAICKHEPQDVCCLRADVPGWLGAAVAATLARQTASRPTVERLAEELRNGEKSSRVGQKPTGRRSVLNRVGNLFGTRGPERPAGAEQSQPAATQQAALRSNPAYAIARLKLGVANFQQGRTEEAISEYHAALRINPNLAEARLNLGVTVHGVPVRHPVA
jgi:serine/threonine protein kinase